MPKTIVKVDPEWNGAHAFLQDVDYILPGWIEVPERLLIKMDLFKPFAKLSIKDDVLIDISKGSETEASIEISKANKISELSNACKETIVNGFEVSFSNHSGHISLSTEDQTNLQTAVSIVNAGAKQALFHIDGHEYELFDAEDILEIKSLANEHINYNLVYYHIAKNLVSSYDSSEKINAFSYGDKLPEEYEKQLMNLLASSAS